MKKSESGTDTLSAPRITKKRRKKSRQRDAIMEFLASRKDHPTADTVYENVRQVIPNISLGTVYRNLSLLTDEGSILRLSFDGDSDRYDATTAPHMHFKCRICGGVSDMQCQNKLENVIEDAMKDFPGIVEGHNTYFFGVCPSCTRKMREQQEKED